MALITQLDASCVNGEGALGGMLAEHACIEHKELAISYVIMYSAITLLFLFCPGLFSSQIRNTANYVPLVSPCGSCSWSVFPVQAHFTSCVDFLCLGQLSIFARSLARGECDLGRCPTPKIYVPCAHGITHATFSFLFYFIHSHSGRRYFGILQSK